MISNLIRDLILNTSFSILDIALLKLQAIACVEGGDETDNLGGRGDI